MKPIFNSKEMMAYAHQSNEFNNVLHVAHHEWHGIRNATASCPGNKLLISADTELTELDKFQISSEIEKKDYRIIVFQGYSLNADELLLYLKAKFGDDLRCFAITHVNTVQFENYFELRIQEKLFLRKKYGILEKIASVKPGFGLIFETYWKETIINFAPKVEEEEFMKFDKTISIYCPLESSWRKNLYTNVLAATLIENVKIVKLTNYPNGLENIFNLNKLRLVGFLEGRKLLQEMANSTIIIMVTLAECQPMTQLESFAVGTPSLTGPLQLKEFQNDELYKISTCKTVDNPILIKKAIERLLEEINNHPSSIKEMIKCHLALRHKIAFQRYLDFING